MLISTRYKFIFFHLPKTAGSSVSDALRIYSDYPLQRVYHYAIDYLGEKPWLNLYPLHISPKQLRDKMKSQSNFDSFFKFAFVRNTWDWHVSQFMYHTQKTNSFFHYEFKGMSFEDYVDWAIKEENIKKAKSRQWDFLSDNSGELLVDFVGKYETLQEDYDLIKKRIGVGKEIPVANASQRSRDYSKYYTEESKQAIYNSHKKDIETFGFYF